MPLLHNFSDLFFLPLPKGTLAVVRKHCNVHSNSVSTATCIRPNGFLRVPKDEQDLNHSSEISLLTRNTISLSIYVLLAELHTSVTTAPILGLDTAVGHPPLSNSKAGRRQTSCQEQQSDVHHHIAKLKVGITYRVRVEGFPFHASSAVLLVGSREALAVFTNIGERQAPYHQRSTIPDSTILANAKSTRSTTIYDIYGDLRSPHIRRHGFPQGDRRPSFVVGGRFSLFSTHTRVDGATAIYMLSCLTAVVAVFQYHGFIKYLKFRRDECADIKLEFWLQQGCC